MILSKVLIVIYALHTIVRDFRISKLNLKSIQKLYFFKDNFKMSSQKMKTREKIPFCPRPLKSLASNI